MEATGERPSFAAVYREHLGWVRDRVRRLGVPPADAPDLAQDVLVAVWRALPGFDATRPFRAWLKAITYRTARDYLERQRRREALLREPQGWREARNFVPTPEEQLAAREAQRVLSEVLRTAGPVFAMSEVDGLTQAAIGQALGLPEWTVQSRLRRARSEFAAAVRRYQARAAAGR